MAMLWFYCDESYDSKSQHPRSYAVAGFLANEVTWSKIEKRWAAKNKLKGVSRFHASHLNAYKHEFSGWTRQRSKRYVQDLLGILGKQKKRLHAFSVGILAIEYERIISEPGRKKFGSPYIVCFKQCVALIAEELHRQKWPEDVQFSVILDQNSFQLEAVEMFYKMKDDASWGARCRLATCAPGKGKEFVALEPADLIAYETFKMINDRHYGRQRIRKAMEKLFPVNGFAGFYYDSVLLEHMKPMIEEMQSGPNGLIIIQQPPYVFNAK